MGSISQIRRGKEKMLTTTTNLSALLNKAKHGNLRLYSVIRGVKHDKPTPLKHVQKGSKFFNDEYETYTTLLDKGSYKQLRECVDDGDTNIVLSTDDNVFKEVITLTGSTSVTEHGNYLEFHESNVKLDGYSTYERLLCHALSKGFSLTVDKDGNVKTKTLDKVSADKFSVLLNCGERNDLGCIYDVSSDKYWVVKRVIGEPDIDDPTDFDVHYQYQSLDTFDGDFKMEHESIPAVASLSNCSAGDASYEFRDIKFNVNTMGIIGFTEPCESIQLLDYSNVLSENLIKLSNTVLESEC